jgi:hypothetical protein
LSLHVRQQLQTLHPHQKWEISDAAAAEMTAAAAVVVRSRSAWWTVDLLQCAVEAVLDGIVRSVK